MTDAEPPSLFQGDADDDGNDWLERVEPGWTSLTPPQSFSAQSFVSGDPRGDRVRIRYLCTPADATVAAKIWFGPGTQGPPGHVHGGSIAAVLDETMGAVVWMAGQPAVAGELTMRFRQLLPLETFCVLKARVVSVDGRKVRTTARLYSRQGELHADAEALFIELDPARFGGLLQRAKEMFGKPGTGTPS